MKVRPLTLISAFGLSFLAGSACPPIGEAIEPVSPPEQPASDETTVAEKVDDEAVEKAAAEAAEEAVDEKQVERLGSPLPHFLVMGGGYKPSGNQVSLEKNVLYFRRVLGELDLLKAPRHLLFADGRDEGLDLQFMDPAFNIPELNRAFAELFGTTKGIANQYRSNELSPNGPSSLVELDKWLKDTGSKLKEDDRLILYFTGHGGKGDRKTPQNTTAFLWNNQKVYMKDFTKRLDKLPVETPVVLVMVQCYSGGFANLIFKDGDPKKGMAEHQRAGFFATVYNRVAAGCTPDIREENYQEYSTSFWEALCGKTRLGASIEKPDFDGDGKISYVEAHAHVLLTSETVDIPIKTSGTFLRQYSKPEQPKDKNASKSDSAGKWLSTDDVYADILKQASPADRAVLEGLSLKLKLGDDNRAKEARDLMNELESQRRKLALQKKKPEGERNLIKGKLAKEIRKRWPEVGNPYHPNARALFEPGHAKQVLAVLKRGGQWAKFLKAKQLMSKLDKQRFELDRRKVKCMRFLRTLENVVLETNLHLAADERIQRRFEKLRALENGTLEADGPDA